MDTRIEQLDKIYNELYEIANSYAGEKTGTIAVELHAACIKIVNSIRMIENGIKPEDEAKLLTEWFNAQPGLKELLKLSSKL